MNRKDLKWLTRAELIEMLIEQSKWAEEIEKKADQVSLQLVNRDIKINNAGSIAEAALRINGVFDAVQAAAEQYLDNVKKLSEDKDRVLAQREEEVKARCEQYVANAKAQAEKCWEDISSRIDSLSKSEVDEIIKTYKSEMQEFDQ